MIRVLEALGEPFSYGGEEAFVINLLTHMNLEGMRVDVLTPYYSDNEHYIKIVERLGGHVYQLDAEFNPGRSRQNIAEPLNKFLNGHEYDIAHIHTGSISAMQVMAHVSKAHGLRVIVHSHMGQLKSSPKHGVVREIRGRQMAQDVDVYCACTRLAARTMFRRSVANNNAILVNNGIDLNTFAFNPRKRAEVRERLGVPRGHLIVGHVGRFAYEKNHPFILKVFAEVRKQVPKASLLLVGDGEELEQDKRLASELGVFQSTIFTGNVSNVQDYLSAMDVFLFPSYFEGLGIVCVEAQASGLPVVLSSSVPKVDVMPNCVRLPLDTAAKSWANKVIELGSRDRTFCNLGILKSAGFDANDTGAQIRNIYFDLANK